MNKRISAIKHHPRREAVRIRSASGITDFRRIWGGIAWPVVPNPGAVCIVGELMPDRENVTLDTLYLLSYAAAITTDALVRACIDRKDHYCVSRFFVNASNEAFLDQLKKADGLSRYALKENYKDRFPYFRGSEHVARIDEAPQAENPDFGRQLIRDCLEGNQPRLLISDEVAEAFRVENVLPITKDMLSCGVHPAIDALRYVLAAYVTKPYYTGSRDASIMLVNWNAKGRKANSEGFREWYTD